MTSYCDHPDYTPAEMAEFDQDWAALSHRLQGFIFTYANVMNEAPSCPIGVRSGLADFIEDMTSHESCAELLACAIAKLHALSSP